MPIIIYVVAIFVVVFALCFWFYFSKFREKKVQKKLLDDLKKKEEVKEISEAQKKQEEAKSESLENFSLDESEDQDSITVQQKSTSSKFARTAFQARGQENSRQQSRNVEQRDEDGLSAQIEDVFSSRHENLAESQQADEESDEDDDLEQRFKEYEKFLRERLMSEDEESENDEDDSDSIFIEQQERESENNLYNWSDDDEDDDEITSRIRSRLQTRVEQESPSDFSENGEKIEVQRADRRLLDEQLNSSEIDDEYEFSVQDVLAIQNFDMKSVEGKSMREIEKMLASVPPRARRFLLSQIMQKMGD